MTNNFLIVTDSPFPEWGDSLDANLTYADQVFDADGWSRVIFEHYKNIDALITDFAPSWPTLGNSVAISEWNGLNALLGAKENALPSFVYSQHLSELVVVESYKAECNAVVHSYSHTLSELRKIIDTTISKDKDDPERIWIDTKNLSENKVNHVLAVCDETLRRLSHTEIKMFLLIVCTQSYEEAANRSGYKPGYLRNKGSEIFQKCGFKTRSSATAHASRIGVLGIT